MVRMELNSLCKPMKKVRSSQASIAINSCTELSKTPIFPVTIFKRKFKLTSPKRNISKKSEKMARWKKLHINFISKKYYTLALNHEVYNEVYNQQLFSFLINFTRTFCYWHGQKSSRIFRRKFPGAHPWRSATFIKWYFNKQ